MTLYLRIGLLLACPFTASCGPEVATEPDLDLEEVLEAFCEKLFACPEEEAIAEYGSQDACEDVHRDDYESRDRACKDVVLAVEDCLAELSCNELPGDCKDQLSEEGCEPL